MYYHTVTFRYYIPTITMKLCKGNSIAEISSLKSQRSILGWVRIRDLSKQPVKKEVVAREVKLERSWEAAVSLYTSVKESKKTPQKITLALQVLLGTLTGISLTLSLSGSTEK